MSKELVIGSNHHETKVAVLEDDQLVEIFFQRANEYSLAGSIHKGRVTRVLPGMQSAFVDLGLERDTFLYVSDFFEEHPDIDTLTDEKAPRSSRSDERRDRSPDRETPRETSRILPVEEPEPAPVEGAQSAAAGSQQEKPAGENDADSSRDRRGRRSRRRRSKGRGFPDTKYAQPPVAGQAPEALEETGESEGEAPSDVMQSDVIVLPGESLAKYRGVRTAPQESRAAGETEEDAYSREPLPAENQPDSTPDLIHGQGKSGQHARDLRYDDFAIHVVSELDDEAMDAAEARAEEIAEIVESQHAALENDQMPAGEMEIEFVTEQPEDEFAVLVLESEFEPAADQGGADAEESASNEDAEATGGNEGGETPEPPSAGPLSEAAQTGENREGQSAAVREQGGRYLQHRTSRRMRRRRGKFNQQVNAGEGVAASPAGGPVAAAPARAAEVREESKPEQEDREANADRPLPSITDLLKEGQEIIVQIAKEPLGQKGARITSHIALPGRYVVYMPSVDHLGVSRKIASDEERHRLKSILQAHRVGTTGGFIVRTAGEGQTEEEIAADMNFLYNLWLDIRAEGGEEARARSAASRSGRCAAHSARPVDRRLQGHLGGQRRDLRERAALRAAFPAGAGQRG